MRKLLLALLLALSPLPGLAAYIPFSSVSGGIVSTPSIAALRAATATSLPQTLTQVLGYTALGDGGSGPFAVNATDASSPDNGCTIIVDTSGRRWYRQTNLTAINIQWCGGGPTRSDNAPFLTAALAVLPATGGAVYIPTGNYSFGSQIAYTIPSTTAAVSIFGDGQDGTILTWAAGQGMAITYVGPFDSIHIHDLSFLTGTVGTASQTALTLTMQPSDANAANSALSSIENITIRGSDGYSRTNFWSTGINVQAVSNINFTGMHFVGPSAIGGNGVILAGNSTTPAVIFNFTDSYFETLNQGIVYGQYTQGVTVSQSNFTGGNYGVANSNALPGLDQLIVMGSTFECVHGGIVLMTGVPNTNITGDLFIIPSNAYGLYFTAGTSAWEVVGNSFVPDTAATTTTGIAVVASTLTGTVLANNFLALTLGIQLATAATGVNVQSNAYSANTNNISNLGTGNTIGGGSP